MRLMILGAAGMIGRKLTNRLITKREILQSNDELILHDIITPPMPEGHKATCLSGDLSDPSIATILASYAPDIIFHLASIVSGEAEADFDKGWAVNMGGNHHLCEALRAQHEQSAGTYRPRVIFASSIAVFGPPFPETAGIDDYHSCRPQTSYGAQKAISELLFADYARKGFIEAINIRLPTICVRPGKANAAASSFFSGIIREPLQGESARLPVSDTVRHWHASPRSAARFFTHAAQIDTQLIHPSLTLNMPGLSVTVAEQIETLRAVAGEACVAHIQPDFDETISAIVQSWPQRFNPEQALSLGFRAETDFKQIIEIFIEDDLPNHFKANYQS